MPTPTPSWNSVRVHGTWVNQDGSLKAGSYKVTIPVRVTNDTDDVIIPSGTFASGTLNTTNGLPSFDLQIPATDDPDNSPPFQVVIEITFPDAFGERYQIDIPIALKDDANGLDLEKVVLTSSFSPVEAIVKGIPGGVAALDSAGFVIDAAGNRVTTAGTLAASSNLSDVPNKATARGNLGLGTASTHPAGDFATPADLSGKTDITTVAGTATASATLTAGKHTPVDATSGAKTMTLPTTAAAGVLASVEKTDATTNAVTITGTLRGATSSIPLTSQYEARTFLSEGAGSWRPISDHRTAASLASTFVATKIINAATYGNGTTDATAHIQGLSDALAASGGGWIYAPPGVYRHTFIELGNNVFLRGAGAGATIFKLVDGVAFRSGNTWSGTYGISTKSGVTHSGVFDLSYDGNYTGTADYANQFNSIFDTSSGSGVFTVGRYKAGGIVIANLNRTDWVAPDHFWVDNVESHDCVRSCFLFQMADGRTGNPGHAHVGKIHARNSALDHLIYADEADTVVIQELHASGYARDGMVILSGAKVGALYFSDLAPNPNSNPTYGLDWQTQFCIDDRPDDKGSIFDKITIKGDLAALGGTINTRGLLRSRGYAVTVNSLQVEHTGADPDTFFMMMYVEGTSGSPGTQKGPTLRGVKGRALPGQTRLFAHDPSGYGSKLYGGVVEDAFLSYHASAASQAGAVFTFNGNTVRAFKAANVEVETEDGGVRGPSAIYQNACTSSFRAGFDNVDMPRALPANPPWIDATTVATGTRLSRCVTTAGAPVASLKQTVNMIDNCTFAATTIRNSDILVAYKTGDQSVTSSVTLVNDTHLKVDVVPNAVYTVEADLIVDADIAADVKFRLTPPAGTTMDYASVGPALAATAGADNSSRWRGFVSTAGADVDAGGVGAGTLFPFMLRGIVYVGATGGTVQLKWAQATSGTTATILKKGSSLRLNRVA